MKRQEPRAGGATQHTGGHTMPDRYLEGEPGVLLDKALDVTRRLVALTQSTPFALLTSALMMQAEALHNLDLSTPPDTIACPNCGCLTDRDTHSHRQGDLCQSCHQKSITYHD